MCSGPPDAPNTPRVHEVTASTAHISWHEPKDNGSPILGYWIERKEVNSKHWTRVNRALLNSLEVKVTGLMEGLTYIFRVCAENLAGPGPFSDPTDRIVAMDEIREFFKSAIPKENFQEKAHIFLSVASDYLV